MAVCGPRTIGTGRPSTSACGGSGNHRPGERPAPGLVYARDARDLLLPEHTLEFKTVTEFGGHGEKFELIRLREIQTPTVKMKSSKLVGSGTT